MYKAIIFDLDGTLLNTLGDIRYVLNESLAKFGLLQLSVTEAMALLGNGAKRLVFDAVGENNRAIAGDVYEYYSKLIAACANDKTELYEGEESTLSVLKVKGVKFAIITNKPQKAAENNYQKYLSEFGFDCVLGQTDKFPLKPDPASTLAVIKKLGVDKSECLFVGDGETDVLTAKAANIKCVSALWGYRTRQQLDVAGATDFAQKFSDLINYFNV
ncbi:MAG: HAD family hydrolase [Clostridia bacterium]|nr:HAD family hydrolase [Clostridia bacterium]